MGTISKIIKAVPSKSLRPVAEAYREKYGITESVNSVMDALNKQFTENPEAAQAANQFRGNPGKILDAVEDKIDVKQLRSDMQQPPRASRQESIQSAPFTPPTVVSKAPVPALTPGAQLVARPEPRLMDATYMPPGGNEVPAGQLTGTTERKLLPEAPPRTLEERIAKETEAKAQSEAEQAIPESYKAKGLAIPLAGATTLAGALTRDQNGKEPGEVPAGAETAKEVKLAPPAAPTPKGGVGTKPTDTQPVTPGKESQATTTQAIAGAAKLSDKVAASKSGAASKPTLDELTGYLDSVAKDVNNDPRFNNTNIERDLLAARAEAYKMYKEKADRNQLLGTVERAINAIAQFASAQAGFGTRQAGGNLPLSSADYGGQTEQAFKEYQTEVGLIGEEQKVGERAKERTEAAKEKEIGRRQKTVQEKIETERDVLKEAAAERRARIGAESREDIAKLRASLPKAPSPAKISGIDSEIRTTQAAIKEASKFASAASNDAASKALAGFLTATGLSPEEVDTEIKTRSAGFFTGPSKREARQQFASERMQELRDRLDSLKSQRVELLTGQVSAYTEVESAPAGQAPANGGMVTVILDGKRGQIPSSQLPAFTKKHPNAIVE